MPARRSRLSPQRDPLRDAVGARRPGGLVVELVEVSASHAMWALATTLEPRVAVWRLVMPGLAALASRRERSHHAHASVRAAFAAAGERPAFVSMSYAGTCALVAAGDQPLGIDVEPILAGTSLLRQAARVFSAAEIRQIEEAPGAERERLAVRFWTRKEALLKALGTGIDRPLSEVCTASGVAEAAWRFLDVDAGEDVMASLAWRLG